MGPGLWARLLCARAYGPRPLWAQGPYGEPKGPSPNLPELGKVFGALALGGLFNTFCRFRGLDAFWSPKWCYVDEQRVLSKYFGRPGELRQRSRCFCASVLHYSLGLLLGCHEIEAARSTARDRSVDQEYPSSLHVQLYHLRTCLLAYLILWFL